MHDEFYILSEKLYGKRKSEKARSIQFVFENILNKIDIKEDELYKISPKLLELLLMDRTSKKNIRWCTDDYEGLGEGFSFADEITPQKVTGEYRNVIQPRIKKSAELQRLRVREKGEVFTPAWLCNRMNNDVDDEWFDYEGAFTKAEPNDWTVTNGKVSFPHKRKTQEKCWQNYVKSKRLEITCGEAPYLTSRYDMATGDFIPVERRMGLLDRKLRVISEKVRNLKAKRENAKKNWFAWAYKAVQNIYGYEWQGDNLLLARENILATVLEFHYAKWQEEMTLEQAEKIAEVISWNIWQMDGLKFVIPKTCRKVKIKKEVQELDLFDIKSFKISARDARNYQAYLDGKTQEETECIGCAKDIRDAHSGIYCKIKNWSTRKVLKFVDIVQDEESMVMAKKHFKPDVIIGNPPYQEETAGSSSSDKPIYNLFMEGAYDIADKVVLITPGRFLFNAGATPSAWNKKMLESKHLKVLHYEAVSGNIFPNTSIMGGIAVTYYDKKSEHEAIDTFTAYPHLNNILHKTLKDSSTADLTSIIFTQNKFNLGILNKDCEGLNRGDKRLESNIFKLSVFKDEPFTNTIKILGIIDNKRVYRYLDKKYIDSSNSNLFGYKIVVPKSHGAPIVGTDKVSSVIGSPVLLKPNEGYTRTFIGIGNVENLSEAEALMKYVKSKFTRCLLGILKITQDNNPEKWRLIPMQDFTSDSDIDWTKSVSEIDKQLYKKYGLSEDEINFIETKVKEML